MSNILSIIPDNKGGQLKFRVDQILCWQGFDTIPCIEGEMVDIYIDSDGDLVGYSRNLSITDYNALNVLFGRPKGYGMVLWSTYGMSVIWTPNIGDEGYFDE